MNGVARADGKDRGQEASPAVTIVMTARERHGLTERAIESVLANTQAPYRFIYLDVQSPPELRARLIALAERSHLELRHYDEPLWPQTVRRDVTADLGGDYVVFMDNDVVVETGWLDALLRCADETGAGIVGPLYLWSDGVSKPRIHMAGGRLVETREAAGRVLDESHLLYNADPEIEAGKLQRRPCDFVEFHCMLMRRELLGDGSLFDPAIRCVHEHVDAALTARERGFSVMFEPAAVVTYLAFAPYSLDDLQLLRSRWNADEGEASIVAFARKWNVIDDTRSFWGARTFLGNHPATSDPIRPLSRRRNDLSLAMGREELCHTRSDLLDLAQQRGYQAHELLSLSDAYARAQMLANAGYRPCGRPFLNHLVGSAGVLLRYSFRIDIVAAALLHAAYTHCPPINGGAQAAVAQVETLLGGKGSAIERRVRAYTLREYAVASPEVVSDPGSEWVFDVEIFAIAAANEIDMHLSGEVRYSGRGDVMPADMRARVTRVCAKLGVPGLAATLEQAVAAPLAIAAELQSNLQVSYRLGGRVPGPINMLSDAPTAL